VVRDGAILRADAADENVRGVPECNSLMAANPHVMATALYKVGIKGYDGLIRALVTG
jgi:hypothetical protein